ncbi:hypothetical protein DFH08DRAFT_901870 [Mycena albidolilacea]|uniref:Uncharacterized protein n=1 Tax=Mycena albidolilacea TaxID=1033008 RepID=A0AAD6Z3V5_9AGAR|nr:hypothetical protein DFH08DRAFT_901870 [Mycena albidolilacea]
MWRREQKQSRCAMHDGHRTAPKPQRSETALTPLQQTLRNQRRQLADLLVDVVPPPPLDRVVRLAPPAALLVREEGRFGFCGCASVSVCAKREERAEGRARYRIDGRGAQGQPSAPSIHLQSRTQWQCRSRARTPARTGTGNKRLTSLTLPPIRRRRPIPIRRTPVPVEPRAVREPVPVPVDAPVGRPAAERAERGGEAWRGAVSSSSSRRRVMTRCRDKIRKKEERGKGGCGAARSSHRP